MLSVHSVMCNSKKNRFIKQQKGGLLLDIFNMTDLIKKQKGHDFDVFDPENVAGTLVTANEIDKEALKDKNHFLVMILPIDFIKILLKDVI